MSGDSIDLEGLERKDRTELATIATVLGGKPTSRTRKADLVQMILDLAGVGSPSGGSESDGGSKAGSAEADSPTNTGVEAGEAGDPADSGPDDGRSDRRPAGSTSGRTGSQSRGDGTRHSPAEGSSDSGSGGDQAGNDRDSEGSGRQRGQQDRGASRSGTQRGGQSVRSEDRGSRNGQESQQGNGQSGQQGSGQSGASGQSAQSAQSGQGGGSQSGSHPDSGDGRQADDGDTQHQEGEGRKRRRRRGRDRDRNEDGSETQTQWEGEPIEVAGTLDLRDEGYGFLRVSGVMPSRDDVYVSVKQTRQFGLRRGDWLTGTSRPANRGEKNPALLRIDTVNGGDPDRSRERPKFEELTPVFPNEQLILERADQPYDITSRIIDLLAPIGKGQRGLIVSPPKAGKTTVMKTIAQAIEKNHPEVELIVLLVDERPEEVTDMTRSVNGAVVASTFDRPPEEHTQVVELVIERAKRMVEQGQDVVVILDGITRLSRAYNLAAPAGGRIMSGGLDTGALYPPKRFFGAARNIEEGGSLTILATALVDTNSKMDEVIFEEFKGTGNMELRLDRGAAERRVFPAIDVAGSSTRHEELLIDHDRLQLVWKLRRLLAALTVDGDDSAALDLVIDRMRKFPTNDSFLAEIAKGPAVR